MGQQEHETPLRRSQNMAAFGLQNLRAGDRGRRAPDIDHRRGRAVHGYDIPLPAEAQE
jgi:hypothetical protein